MDQNKARTTSREQRGGRIVNKRQKAESLFNTLISPEAGITTEKKASGPADCRKCGATYSMGRWTFEKRPSDPFSQIEPEETICPACVQIEAGEPAGFVYLEGEFLHDHAEEIENLFRNEEAKLSITNPLARIMGWQRSSEGQTVTTTTEHLAQHLGRALKKAYQGEVRYDFSRGNKLVRVYWRRD